MAYIFVKKKRKKILISTLHGKEKTSELFYFNISLQLSTQSRIISILGEEVQIHFPSDGKKKITGLVIQESQSSSYHKIRVAPKIWLLSIFFKHMIYTNTSIPKTIENILIDNKIPFAFFLERNYPKQTCIIQYNETVLSFLQRITKGSGINFLFDHNNNSRVVFFDGEHNPRLFYVNPTKPNPHYFIAKKPSYIVNNSQNKWSVELSEDSTSKGLESFLDNEVITPTAPVTGHAVGNPQTLGLNPLFINLTKEQEISSLLYKIRPKKNNSLLVVLKNKEPIKEKFPIYNGALISLFSNTANQTNINKKKNGISWLNKDKVISVTRAHPFYGITSGMDFYLEEKTPVFVVFLHGSDAPILLATLPNCQHTNNNLKRPDILHQIKLCKKNSLSINHGENSNIKLTSKDAHIQLSRDKGLSIQAKNKTVIYKAGSLNCYNGVSVHLSGLSQNLSCTGIQVFASALTSLDITLGAFFDIHPGLMYIFNQTFFCKSRRNFSIKNKLSSFFSSRCHLVKDYFRSSASTITKVTPAQRKSTASSSLTDTSLLEEPLLVDQALIFAQPLKEASHDAQAIQVTTQTSERRVALPESREIYSWQQQLLDGSKEFYLAPQRGYSFRSNFLHGGRLSRVSPQPEATYFDALARRSTNLEELRKNVIKINSKPLDAAEVKKVDATELYLSKLQTKLKEAGVSKCMIDTVIQIAGGKHEDLHGISFVMDLNSNACRNFIRLTLMNDKKIRARNRIRTVSAKLKTVN